MAALAPEQHARQQIDAQLTAAGWAVQDYTAYSPSAATNLARPANLDISITTELIFSL